MKRSGIECPEAIEKLVKYWDNLFYTNKALFQANKAKVVPAQTDDIDFLQIFTDPCGLIQYGQRTKACQLIKDHVIPKLSDEIEASKAFIKAFEGGSDELKMDDGLNLFFKL